MKRFIFLLLAVVMLLSLTACGDNKTNGSMTEPTASPSIEPHCITRCQRRHGKRYRRHHRER